MPLPTDARMAWPPTEWLPLQHDIDEAAVWYAGDEGELAKFYGGVGENQSLPTDSPNRKRLSQVASKARFWSRRNTTQDVSRQKLHIPAAADVAATSADLLFGEEASFTIADAHGETKDEAAVKTEQRLAHLVEVDKVSSTLLEAAEVCAALGGVYLRAMWNKEIADHPLLNVVHADCAVPEFRFGYLTAVTFWKVVLQDEKGQVWRHLERHEKGVILHGLYAGTGEQLGVKRNLKDHPDTEGLVDQVPIPEAVNGLTVRYVPNVLPNRKHRGRPIGRADVAGTWSLMDALDETWTSWMRDIRLGKGRIIVPTEFLNRRGRGLGSEFDLDAEVFAPLDMDPSKQDKAGITESQFEIRTEQHSATAQALLERIILTAGYSPQTFGLEGGKSHQVTATEVRADQGRSLRTTGRKQRYWEWAVEDIAEVMLIIDAIEFGSGVEPMRPRIDFGESISSDVKEMADTVVLLNQAEAASVETRVRMSQPHLDEDEVDAEVRRILDEKGLSVEAPDGRPPVIVPPGGAA